MSSYQQIPSLSVTILKIKSSNRLLLYHTLPSLSFSPISKHKALSYIIGIIIIVTGSGWFGGGAIINRNIYATQVFQFNITTGKISLLGDGYDGKYKWGKATTRNHKLFILFHMITNKY